MRWTSCAPMPNVNTSSHDWPVQRNCIRFAMFCADGVESLQSKDAKVMNITTAFSELDTASICQALAGSWPLAWLGGLAALLAKASTASDPVAPALAKVRARLEMFWVFVLAGVCRFTSSMQATDGSANISIVRVCQVVFDTSCGSDSKATAQASPTADPTSRRPSTSTVAYACSLLERP